MLSPPHMPWKPVRSGAGGSLMDEMIQGPMMAELCDHGRRISTDAHELQYVRMGQRCQQQSLLHMRQNALQMIHLRFIIHQHKLTGQLKTC